MGNVTIWDVCTSPDLSRIECDGNDRCCKDCLALHALQRSITQRKDDRESGKEGEEKEEEDKKEAEEDAVVVLHFGDVHSSVVTAAGVGMAIFVLLYLTLFCTRERLKAELKEKKQRDTDGTNNNTRKRYFMGTLACLNMFMIFILLVYVTQHTVRRWETVRECQMTLFTVLSWCMVLFLAVVDFGLCVLPVSFSLTRNKVPSPCRVVASKITCLVGGMGLVWWLFVGIYLEGAINDRWHLYL